MWCLAFYPLKKKLHTAQHRKRMLSLCRWQILIVPITTEGLVYRWQYISICTYRKETTQMNPYENHASELIDMSQQASIPCSANILLLILKSMILTTVSTESAEPVVEKNSIKHKHEDLINCRKKSKGFGSEIKVLEYYGFFINICYLIPSTLNKKKKNISHVWFQCHCSKQSSLRISQKISMILSRSANTTACCQHTFSLLSSFCHLNVCYIAPTMQIIHCHRMPRNGRSLGKFPNVQHMLLSWKLEPHHLLSMQAVPS